MKGEVYTDGQRVFYIDAKTGLHHEITPVCVHCKKIDGTKKCEIDPGVVHCCGQCVTTCKNYKRPAQQLDLFPSQIIELEIPPDEKLSKVLKYYRNRRV